MTTGQQAPLPASNIAAIAARAAGTPSQGGGIRLIERPFAFDTPGLTTGAAVYTPTVGDILLDAWVEIDTAWDGTTPKGDFGFFGADGGWLGYQNNVVDMTLADNENQWGAGLLVENSAANVLTPASMSQTALAVLNDFGGTFRMVPAKFTTADPIKVVVSQDGTNTGDDPGSTQGAGLLVLLIATPSDE